MIGQVNRSAYVHLSLNLNFCMSIARLVAIPERSPAMALHLIGIINDTTSACWQQEGFGPAVGSRPCARKGPDMFDFTLIFEQSMMSILPSVSLLLVVPLRCIQLKSRPRKTKGDITEWIKVVSYRTSLY